MLVRKYLPFSLSVKVFVFSVVVYIYVRSKNEFLTCSCK